MILQISAECSPSQNRSVEPQNQATRLPPKAASRTSNVQPKANNPTETVVSCKQVAKFGCNEVPPVKTLDLMRALVPAKPAAVSWHRLLQHPNLSTFVSLRPPSQFHPEQHPVFATDSTDGPGNEKETIQTSASVKPAVDSWHDSAISRQRSSQSASPVPENTTVGAEASTCHGTYGWSRTREEQLSMPPSR